MILMNREIGVLEEAQRLLSTERHSNMAIYFKIAAMLPHKTVRDVAFKFMELNNRVSVFFYVKIIFFPLEWIAIFIFTMCMAFSYPRCCL